MASGTDLGRPPDGGVSRDRLRREALRVLCRASDVKAMPLPTQKLAEVTTPLLLPLLEVRPHPEHPHHPLRDEHLVDQPLLDVDAPGVRPGQVADELLEGRGGLRWR